VIGRPDDLLIYGGTVLDPAAKMYGAHDLVIADGRVRAVGGSLPRGQAARELEASGKLVLPGLIDLHTHVFWGYHGAHADEACLPRGTTTALDAGSCGANAFHAFRELVIKPGRTRVQAWLNISTIGLIDIRVGELLNLLYVDVERAVSVAWADRDLVIGFKIRISEYVAGADFRPALKLAREAADAAQLPIMVHIGETNDPLPTALQYLRPGDMVTHAYTGRRHGILDYRGKLLSGVVEARQAGVWFDAAHGRRHFGFDTIRRALEQDFVVDTLSSDTSSRSVTDAGYHLPLLMSKLMALGMDLREVAALVTSAPARFLGRSEDIGTLRPGARGDVAILERVEGDFTLEDSEGQMLKAHQRLRPWRTVLGGEIVEPPAGA
jgi:dihydroorotase